MRTICIDKHNYMCVKDYLKTEYYPFHEANVSLDTLLSANGRIFLLPIDFSGRVVCF